MMTNFLPVRIRSAAILTNAYVAGTILKDCSGYDQLTLYVDFTIGSLTDLQVKVEFSVDGGTTYAQETFSSISTTTDTLSLGIHKMAGSGVFTINVPVQGDWIKVSAIGTGTVTNSSCAITGVLSKL